MATATLDSGRFQRIARAMSRDYGLQVKFANTSPKMDGKTLYLPANADFLSDKGQELLHGFTDHEALHFEEEQLAIAARAAGKRVRLPSEVMASCGRDAAKAMMLNAFEDIRIETRAMAERPGTAENLRAVHQHARALHRAHKAKVEADFWTAMAIGVVGLAHGADVSWMSPTYQALLGLLSDEIKDSRRQSSVEDALALAERSMTKLSSMLSDAEQEQDKREQADEDGEGDEGDDDKNGKDSDDSDEDEDEQNEQKGSGESSESDDEDSDEDEDADGEGDAEDSDEDADDDSEDEGKGDSDDDGAEDDEDASGEGGDDDSDEDDADEDDSTDDSEGSEDGDDSDDDADEDGDDGEGDGDDEGDDSDSDGDEGDDGEGDSDGKAAKDKGKKPAKDKKPSDSALEGMDDGELQDAIRKLRQQHEKPGCRDILDDLRAKLEMEIKTDLSGNRRWCAPEHIIKGDTINPAPVIENAARIYDDAKNTVNAQIAGLKSKLTTTLRARAQTYISGDRDRGMIDSSALHSLKQGNKNVFAQRTEAENIDTAVTILVDMSGSMGGTGERGKISKAKMAMMTAIALAETFVALNIPFEVLGFDAGGSGKGGSWGRGDHTFTRWECSHIHIYKTFAENYRQVRLRMPDMGRARGNNIDCEAVEQAARRLVVRKESRKILLVLSDGYPAGGADTAAMNGRLCDVVKMITASGIDCLGVGIQSPAVRDFYNPKNGSAHVVINDVDTMAVEVYKLMRGAMLSRLGRKAA